MPNILTPTEGANFVRTEETNAVMLMLLPHIDSYINNATGHDWTTDSTIHPTAKLAAGILLVNWYDNPLQVGQSADAALPQLSQLEGEALKYRKIEFYGRTGAGAIALAGALYGDTVLKLVGVAVETGDQSAKFEDAISVVGQIQQTSAADLSENMYVVVLKHPKDDVSA
jgi:hypothetical protein